MTDVLTRDTGSDTTLSTAAAAITDLLSLAEEPQEREAPRRKPAAPAPEPEEVETAEPEDEGETEQAPADEEPEEQDEPEDDKRPEPRKLRVKVDGQELELPEDEVVKGYSRNADYTQKTQKLAEERKAFQSEAEAVRAERQKYATDLKQLEEFLASTTPAEPDWDTLRAGDPAVFAATYAAWDQRQKQLDAVARTRAEAEQRVNADRVAQLQEHLKAEAAKLVEVIPAWKNAEVAKKEKTEIAEYARSQGFTDDDLKGLTDHRVIKILRDAARFQKAEKQKPAIRERIEQAKVATPGSSEAARPRVTELTRRKQALAKTGSLADAGAVIAQLLQSE